MVEETLTKKDIKKQVGCPGYVIDYLFDCGRLPVIRESVGSGHVRLYDPSAVDVVKAHLARNK